MNEQRPLVRNPVKAASQQTDLSTATNNRTLAASHNTTDNNNNKRSKKGEAKSK
jgi:hypothetical protein